MSVAALSQLELSAKPTSVIGGAEHFSDVPDSAYYVSAASWAKAKGLVSGDGVNFMPNHAVTRADWTTILYRYTTFSGLSTDSKADLSVFRDKDVIPAYASDTFSWAYPAGILAGKDEGLLDPLPWYPDSFGACHDGSAFSFPFVSYFPKRYPVKSLGKRKSQGFSICFFKIISFRSRKDFLPSLHSKRNLQNNSLEGGDCFVW